MTKPLQNMQLYYGVLLSYEINSFMHYPCQNESMAQQSFQSEYVHALPLSNVD